jgi:hypothetical protein
MLLQTHFTTDNSPSEVHFISQFVSCAMHDEKAVDASFGNDFDPWSTVNLWHKVDNALQLCCLKQNMQPPSHAPGGPVLLMIQE